MSHIQNNLHSSSSQIQQELGYRLEQIRLGRNISQAALATEAGVSRRTITRLEQGESVSLDTLIRVLQVLGFAERLQTLLPSPAISPIERVRRKGKPRQRARAKSQEAPQTWEWADKTND